MADCDMARGLRGRSAALAAFELRTAKRFPFALAKRVSDGSDGWLLGLIDVQTWSQPRRGSFERSISSAAVAEGKSKDCTTQLCESVPKLPVSSSRATCNAQSVGIDY